MKTKQLIVIAGVIIVILAIFGIYFTVQDASKAENTPDQNPSEQEFDFVKEDESSSPTPEFFESFGLNKLKVNVYGGPSDIKTTVQGQNEYALIRNPKNIGGLDFVSSDSFGEYYFAEDVGGDRIIYKNGSPGGRFGYTDFGEVSLVAISERIPSADFYAAYPSSELASKSGFQLIEDTGVANRFLSTRYLKIKNLTNNREVIVEIDSRNNLEDTLLVSEATRVALGVDNNMLGSFDLQIVDKETNTLGVVRK
jgi:uncharacterized protein YpmB